MEKIDFKDISFIVQGPIYDNYTPKVCESIRMFAPESEIVISTWRNSNLRDLDYDILVESDDPGNFVFVLPENMDNGSDLYQMNVNRQIVSTIQGLKNATRKYACKLRSDLIITGTNFINYFFKYNLPIMEPYNSLLSHRVVTLTSVNPKRYNPFAYYLCDWFFFGLRDDLINIWDIPLIESKLFRGQKMHGYYQMVENFGNEQYIWMGFLNKIQKINIQNGYQITDDILRDSEKSYANCCIFATAKNANVYSLKVKNTGYGDRTSLSNAGLYTENDWIRMYNKYCDGKIRAGSDIIEHMEFHVAKNIRALKKTKMKSIYSWLKKLRS